MTPGLSKESCRKVGSSDALVRTARATSQGGERVPIYLAIGQMLIAAALIGAVLLQVQGGGLGGIFGQSDGVYRTRRGIERTLFRLTIILAVVFVVMAMLTVALT